MNNPLIEELVNALRVYYPGSARPFVIKVRDTSRLLERFPEPERHATLVWGIPVIVDPATPCDVVDFVDSHGYIIRRIKMPPREETGPAA